jgi:tRNA U38,U39,U40 pseudouridine synthase TruA
MGFDEYRRTITITISAEEFHCHFAGYEREYEYRLTDLRWTKIIRPDEDFQAYLEMPVDDFKGASGTQHLRQ